MQAHWLAVHLADVLHLEGQVVSDCQTLALDDVAVGQRQDGIATVGQVMWPRQVAV